MKTLQIFPDYLDVFLVIFAGAQSFPEPRCQIAKAELISLLFDREVRVTVGNRLTNKIEFCEILALRLSGQNLCS